MPTIRTPVLEIAYQEFGPAEGQPVILLHGWPSDVHDYDDVAPPLAKAGFRVLVPWLRGYGATRFLDPATPRSGQQAALGADVRDFMDALSIPQALLVGYDWANYPGLGAIAELARGGSLELVGVVSVFDPDAADGLQPPVTILA